MRIDNCRDGTIRTEFDERLLQSPTCPRESGIDQKRIINEIANCVVVTAAKSTQQSGDQVIDPNALDAFNRLSDLGAERPEREAATHQSERLPH
jgi:hypothetical protein